MEVDRRREEHTRGEKKKEKEGHENTGDRVGGKRKERRAHPQSEAASSEEVKQVKHKTNDAMCIKNTSFHFVMK